MFFGIGHLDLSVSDVEASAAWYEKVPGCGACGGWTTSRRGVGRSSARRCACMAIRPASARESRPGAGWTLQGVPGSRAGAEVALTRPARRPGRLHRAPRTPAVAAAPGEES